MSVGLKHAGEFKCKASIKISLQINGVTVIGDLTDFTGEVKENYLAQFKSIVSELEQQNELIKNS